MSELKSESLWQSAKTSKFGKVKPSSKYDVVVIGGGITGLTAAYQIKKAGKKVCVIERDRIGSVDTTCTTAHLTYVTDQRLTDLVDQFGEEAAGLVWRAGETAIDTIEQTVIELKIACDFRRAPGYLFESLANKEDETVKFNREAALARKLGFPVEYCASVPYFHRPGILIPDQAKFHPLKYIAGLAEAVEGDGCHVFESSEVDEVKADPRTIMVGDIAIETDYIVIATHSPLMGVAGFVNAALFQTKLYPYSSYVIGAKLPKDILPEALFWDTTDPYYYLRVESGEQGDYVIFGGEDHKTGQEPDVQSRFDKLSNMLVGILPEAKLDRQWSGQVIETNDGLPYIGELTEKQLVGTGYSGNGMTFGTLAGLMARDAVMGESSPWKKLFSPNRVSVRAGALDYVAENMDYPYYMLKDRITPTPADDPKTLKPGEGKILLVDKQQAACSRTSDGKLSMVSAKCTHMGCRVQWNNAEETWDCPCHGSRFQPTGEVLAGPAETPLEKVG